MSYTEEEIGGIVAAQRKFFRTGVTLDVKWRIGQLRKLRDEVLSHDEVFERALEADLGRSKVEAYLWPNLI